MFAAAQEKLSLVGRAAPEQQVQFNVFLPLQHGAELDQLLAALHDPSSAQYHQWLTPKQFAASFGAKPEDVNAAVKELSSLGLQVTATHAQSLSVQGSVAAAEQAFGVSLSNAVSKEGSRRLVANGPLVLPAELSRVGAQVVHFSPAIRMRSHGHILPQVTAPDNRESPSGGYWFDDLKQAYSYPSYKAYTGKGVTIGIVDSAGYDPVDVAAYFAHEGLKEPTISEVDIFGGTPYNPANPFNSAETHLDLQQAGGMAPGAHLVLVNIPDLSDASILAGLTTIVEDNLVDVVSMSFGGPEAGYLPAYNDGVNELGILGVYDAMFKQGNSQGITFVASSGDWGALAIPPAACFNAGATSSCGSYQVSATMPASSPHVTGVGGTNLVTTYSPPSLNSAYVSEAAFGDPLQGDIFYGTPATGAYWGSGGGISIYYSKPAYQSLVNTPSKKYRTVPDISLQMGGCPNGAVLPCGPDRSYVWVAIDGAYYGFVGTSISAPDFAGLVALNVQKQKSRMGNANTQIYTLAAAQEIGLVKVFHNNIQGFNGYYSTKPGYNLVLGNGTVDAKDFMLAPNVPSAGIPQTPSNP